MKRWPLVLAAISLLGGCGLFGDKEEELEPKELVDFEQTVRIKRVWNTKVGGESDYLLVGLRPSGDGYRVYAASQDGNVVALNPENGRPVWKTDLRTELSAGPASGDGVVVVAGKDGHIVLLDADSGEEQWRTYIGGETLAHPLIKNDSIVVQSIDNRLQALSRFDGKPRWSIEQSTPALTMRGASSPLLVGSLVVAGFDNGRLLAVNAETGDIEWESLLAMPSGRSDLDRLSDIDGRIAVVGQDLYAAGYQGRIAAIAAESGQILWQKDESTYVGMAADWNNVYTARADGEILAMLRGSGAESWRNDALLRREPTLPVPYQTTVVVGDFEGYLHFFSNYDGSLVARTRFGKDAITSDPLVAGDRLYVQSDNGSVAAYEVIRPEPVRTAPDIAEDKPDSS